MITRIEALRYRCLRYVDVRLDTFQVLVGPNASGKSTLLDVVAFLGDLLREGLLRSVRDRGSDVQNLVWMRERQQFEVAVELRIPAERLERFDGNTYESVRYEVGVGTNAAGELALCGETFWLKPASEKQPGEAKPPLFPDAAAPPMTLFTAPSGKHGPVGWRKVVTKQLESGNDYFLAETTKWNNPFRLGPQKPALANLPEDEERFPVATWARRKLMDGIQRLMLDSEAMRKPAPPGSPLDFQPDGSNLPWAIEDLKRNAPERFDRWMAHVKTALPDLKSIDTIERSEDLHRYLQLTYETGLRVPSWLASDGTLRLLALTLIPYLRSMERVYLIEEPENGIHPRAVEAVFQSLSSAYDAQVMCASHSPVVLSQTDPGQLLCFRKTDYGATAIVRGSEHPILANWQREVDLGTLFAAGVLG